MDDDRRQGFHDLLDVVATVCKEFPDQPIDCELEFRATDPLMTLSAMSTALAGSHAFLRWLRYRESGGISLRISGHHAALEQAIEAFERIRNTHCSHWTTIINVRQRETANR